MSEIKRWTPDDYLRVVCAMYPLVEKGATRRQAISAAQRILPTERHRAENVLFRNLSSNLMHTTWAKVGAMTAEARAQVVATLSERGKQALRPPKVKHTPKRIIQHLPERPKHTRADGKLYPDRSIRHTDVELALLARWIAHQQRDMQDRRALSSLFIAAQEVELSPERRRGAPSIHATTRHLPRRLADAYAKSAKLLADIPFDPLRTEYCGPPAPAELPVPTILAPEPRNQAIEAPAAIPAPTPAPSRVAAHSDPIRAFGMAFGVAMSELIDAVTRQAMSELELHIGQMAERLVARAVQTMGQGVSGMVHGALERELGGPVAPPPDSFELPPGASLPKALQLDVVGLIGHQATEVRSQLNGYADGIRFIEADKIDSWTPRQSVILNTKFISHSAERKCRKVGVKPIRVHGGAAAIVNAIKAICEDEGISLPH